MRIGLAYDLKINVTGATGGEDALEEYDSPETLDLIEAACRRRGHQTQAIYQGRICDTPR